MYFVFVPYKQQIPQWKQCSYDKRTLLILTKHNNYCVQMLQAINNPKTIKKITQNNRAIQQNQKNGEIYNNQNIIQKLITNNLAWFKKYMQNQQKIIQTFIQYKLFQIQDKFMQYCQIINIIRYSSHELLILLENLYVESYYLTHMSKYGLVKQNKIVNKFNISLSQSQSQYLFNNKQHFSPNKTLKRLSLFSRNLTQKIQHILFNYCISNINKQHKQSPADYLYRQQKKIQHKIKFHSLYIGYIMSILIGFIVILIMLSQLNHNTVLSQNNGFKQHFPVWRGTASIIFYIWILGLDVLLYQKTNINFKLIFHNQKNNIPHSKLFFLAAAVLSFIYLIIFLIFILKQTNIIHSNFIYYGHIYWLFLIFVFINPFPIFYAKGRFYVIKLLWRVVFSFCYKMNFIMIWLSQQIVSMIQVITDFWFMVIFFIIRNYQNTTKIVQNINTAVVLTVFGYRMYQNLKLWHQISVANNRQYNFMAPPFLGFIRGFFGFCTGLTAMVYRLNLFNNSFILWLAIAITSTCVAWYVDVRGDWGLLMHQKSTFLRTKLLFQRYRFIYYCIIAVNLALRTAWALTISPFVLSSKGAWPGMYVMIFSFIEIFRRGLWNFLRIQNQHMKNCIQYQATVKDQHILQIVRQKINKQKLDKDNKNIKDNKNGKNNLKEIQIYKKKQKHKKQQKQEQQYKKKQKERQRQKNSSSCTRMATFQLIQSNKQILKQQNMKELQKIEQIQNIEKIQQIQKQKEQRKQYQNKQRLHQQFQLFKYFLDRRITYKKLIMEMIEENIILLRKIKNK